MIGKISVLLFVHCVYSLLRLRKFVSASEQHFSHMPIDILAQIIIAFTLALISILSNTERFKLIRQFVAVKTYDASFQTKNLATYTSTRSELFVDIMKQKLNMTSFELSI